MKLTRTSLSSFVDEQRGLEHRTHKTDECRRAETNKNSAFGSYATVDEHRTHNTEESRRVAGASYAKRVRHMMPSIPPRCESPRTSFAHTAQNVVAAAQRDGSGRHDAVLGFEEGWLQVQARHGNKKVPAGREKRH
jgi:hypothetical protein